MSAICQGFVENAWRKDICSNCFRIRDEHRQDNGNCTKETPDSETLFTEKLDSYHQRYQSPNGVSRMGARSPGVGENKQVGKASENFQKRVEVLNESIQKQHSAGGWPGSPGKPSLGPALLKSRSNSATILEEFHKPHVLVSKSIQKTFGVEGEAQPKPCVAVPKLRQRFPVLVSEHLQNSSETLSNESSQSVHTVTCPTEINGPGAHNWSKNASESSCDTIPNGNVNSVRFSVGHAAKVVKMTFAQRVDAAEARGKDMSDKRSGANGLAEASGKENGSATIVSVNGDTSCTAADAATVPASASTSSSVAVAADNKARLDALNNEISCGNASMGESSQSKSAVKDQKAVAPQRNHNVRVRICSASSSPLRNDKNQCSDPYIGEERGAEAGVNGDSGNIKPTVIALQSRGVTTDREQQSSDCDYVKYNRKSVNIVADAVTISIAHNMNGFNGVEHVSSANSSSPSAAMSLTKNKTTTTSSVATGKKSCRGILKALDNKQGRKLSVKFRPAVCEVIGYGGPEADSEDDIDGEDVPDPQDNVSLAELLAKNATTSEEKHLHELTIKNTNFNSIKTNLLGYAPIEIGPIVGCTNGKSMEKGAKPLVSIGTFEGRKEPLRIRKIITKDDDVLNDSDDDTFGKPNWRREGNSAVVVGKTVKTAPSENGRPGGNKLFQPTVVKSRDNCDVKVVVDSKKVEPSLKASVESPVSNLSRNQVLSKSNQINGNTTEKTNAVAELPQKTDKKEVPADQVPGIKGISKSDKKTVSHLLEPPGVKPKPILKKSEKVCQENVNSKVVPSDANTNAAITVKRSAFLNDIISDRKHEVSSNVSKGTTAKIFEPVNGTPKSTNAVPIATAEDLKSSKIEQTNRMPPGIKADENLKVKQEKEEIKVITSQLKQYNSGSVTNYSDEPMSMLLDSDSLEITSVQPPTGLTELDQKLQVDNKTGEKFKKIELKLSRCKGFEIEDRSSEFDDSLEDSGLDIGISNRGGVTTRIETGNSSESDDNEMIEKGSNSDSGNENDFSERIMDRRDNLFISVDDPSKENGIDSVTKPKLSPDSVIFSSASETSNTGSAESIPECINVHAAIVAAAVKRPAPRPPVPSSKSLEQLSKSLVSSCEQKVADLYDDIGLYRNQTYAPNDDHVEEAVKRHSIVEETCPETASTEDLYDDCTTVSASAKGNKNASGSYDFNGGGGNDYGDAVDSIPLRPSDGIEFIGIRKIDSETHLNENFDSRPTRRSESPKGSKERSSSVSPKPRRKVNQFFSTIGKRAGAAFAAGSSPLSGAAQFMRHKSPSPAPTSTVSNYRRSLSQDEVSMTRTQEIYATFTPASLKFKGLSPMLQKLSKMDSDPSEPKDKATKKNKLFSIKKLLKLGSKEVDFDAMDTSSRNGSDVRSYDFKTESTKTSWRDMSPSPAPSYGSSTGHKSKFNANPQVPSPPVTGTISFNTGGNGASQQVPQANNSHSSIETLGSVSERRQPIGRPPPPPPRVHSLDMLNKAAGSMQNIHGSVKPARPPPPVRSNRIAPSFVSVFANPPTEDVQDMVPPCKPRRKASMNAHSASGLVPRSTETVPDLSLEHNVTSLNFETLKLIAGQEPAIIKRKATNLVKFGTSPLKWSHFYISDREPMAEGNGYAFYSALWEDEPCVLLVQEDVEDQQLRISYSCVNVAATFVDNVPADLIPWSGFSYSGKDITVCVSVLPSCTVKTITNFMGCSSHPIQQKYFALLASLSYWGREDVSDLLVFQGGSKDQEDAMDAELVFVQPAYSNEADDRRKRKTMSWNQSSNDFEINIKQFLLQPHILSQEDRQVLFRFLSGSATEVERQLKLFLQVKLFSSKLKAEDLEKLRRTKSDKVLCQWLEKERALCMKEAIERTLLQKHNEPISPFRKAYVEFLMISDASAKPLLELLLDLSSNS